MSCKAVIGSAFPVLPPSRHSTVQQGETKLSFLRFLIPYRSSEMVTYWFTVRNDAEGAPYTLWPRLQNTITGEKAGCLASWELRKVLWWEISDWD